MALIYTEGFDYYYGTSPTDNATGLHLGKRYSLFSTSSTVTSSYLTIQPGFENRGGCLRSSTTNTSINAMTYDIATYHPSPMTQLCFGMYYQCSNTTASVIRFQNTGSTQSYIELIVNASSNLSIISTSDTVNSSIVGNASAVTFPINTWMHVEVMINISGASAAVQVYQDNALVINLPTLSWYGSGNGVFGIEQIFYGKSTYARYNNRQQQFDHIYMTTGERLGPTEIRPLLPSSDVQKEWTPSTGTDNYAMVNEATNPGMITQVSAPNSGVKDYYNVTGLSLKDQGCTIPGIQPYMFARSTVGNNEKIQTNIKTGSTESGSTLSMSPFGSNTVLYRRSIISSNPDTSSPWTYSDLSSTQLGIARTDDPNWSNVILLANWDNNDVLSPAIDISGNTGSVARSNAAITVQNSSPVNSSYSYYLNKTSGTYYYTITPLNQTVWAFPGAFTFEFWINAVSISNNGFLISNRSDNTSNFGYELQCNSVGVLIFNMGFGSSASSLYTGIDKSSLTGTWAHVAITRDSSNVVRAYLNGAMTNSSAISGTLYQTTQPMWIYASGRGLTGWYGALDDLRVTKSVARYTGSSFTVPSAPYS